MDSFSFIVSFVAKSLEYFPVNNNKNVIIQHSVSRPDLFRLSIMWLFFYVSVHLIQTLHHEFLTVWSFFNALCTASSSPSFLLIHISFCSSESHRPLHKASLTWLGHSKGLCHIRTFSPSLPPLYIHVFLPSKLIISISWVYCILKCLCCFASFICLWFCLPCMSLPDRILTFERKLDLEA